MIESISKMKSINLPHRYIHQNLGYNQSFLFSDLQWAFRVVPILEPWRYPRAQVVFHRCLNFRIYYLKVLQADEKQDQEIETCIRLMLIDKLKKRRRRLMKVLRVSTYDGFLSVVLIDDRCESVGELFHLQFLLGQLPAFTVASDTDDQLRRFEGKSEVDLDGWFDWELVGWIVTFIWKGWGRASGIGPGTKDYWNDPGKYDD